MEAVYDFQGRLVTDLRYYGTYNYYSPTGGPWSKLMHFVVDIVPYILFGNTPDDPAPAVDRILGHGFSEWMWSILYPEEWEQLRGPNRGKTAPCPKARKPSWKEKLMKSLKISWDLIRFNPIMLISK